MSALVTATAQSSPTVPVFGFDSARVRVATKPPGGLDLKVRAADGSWIRVHSTRSPEAEAAGVVDRELGAEVPPLVALVGVGLGFIVDELIRRRPDVRVIAFEVLPDLLTAWRRRQDLSARQASGQLVIGTAPRFEVPSASWPASVIANDPPVLVHAVLGRLFPEAADLAKRAITQLMFERRANEEARQRLAPLFLEHTLKNLPAVCTAPDVSVLDNLAQGQPVVLCGAGPSLDRLLPELKAHRERAWYMALDTALRPLLAAGIVPDMVVSIDPTTLNGRHLLDLPTRERPWLAAEASLDPRVWAAFRGRACVLRVNRADPWTWLETLGLQPTRLQAWGSVLTAACDLILRMKPAGIAFAGVDLAYTDGQPYCRGTAFEEDWEADRQARGFDSVEAVWQARLAARSTVFETDVHGSPALTASHLIAFRNWARSLAIKTPACGFANVTGAGILHGQGIEQLGLGEWLDRWAELRIDRDRLGRCAHQAPSQESPIGEVASALETAAVSDSEPWAGWTKRVPRIDRPRLQRELVHAARQLRAFKGAGEMNATQTAWIDVPYDPANFFAREPMRWVVNEENVGAYAYRMDGKTMHLSFKINYSALMELPSNELYLRIPGGYKAARGTASAVWIGSPAGKEMGYATVHQGLDLLILYRATEERFPIEHGYFFVFGQMTLEVQ